MAPLIELEHATDALQGFVRPHREGREAVKNLISVNVKSKSSDEVIITAFCVRTTAINDDPVEIEVIINKNTDVVNKKIKSISCGCSSGSSKEHCCKHAIATLIYLERNDEDQLEQLSCTDKEQIWGKLRVKTLGQYEPTPLKDFCHLSQQKSLFRRSIADPTPEMEAEFRAMYLADQPSSEAAVFQKETRYKPPKETPSIESVTNIVKKAWTETSYILKKGEEIGSKLYSECLPGEQQYFNECVKVTEEEALCVCLQTVDQCCETWEKARRGRITGSVCYSLFTYSKNKNPNWNKKLEDTFNSQFVGNVHTERGLMYEPDAKEKYEKEKKDMTIITPGLIINPIVPWLGYSADGVVCSKNEVLRLWECKTPAKGKKLGPKDISNSLEYIDKNTKQLKHKHKYYGQIQLGMLLTSTQSCDFTTYCYGSDSVMIENVVLNDTFCLDLIDVLTNTYFKQILPWLLAK